MIACHIREYRNSKAQEYAIHGFSRRLKSLVRCIDNIYRILPPDRVDLPSSEELSDANINLQAFVFNVSGSIDNLAWIWIAEKNIKRDDGSPIPNGRVGLRRKNKIVHDSLSPKLREHLDGLEE
jgi:hypothetical protein